MKIAVGGIALALAIAATTSGQEQTPVEGNPKSKVRVVIFEDLACSDCANFRLMMDQHLLPKFGAKAAFEHRDFPLPKHEWARKAAIAARYFGSLRPELGTEWRRWALAHLDQITAANFDDTLTAWAARQKIDGAKALAALADKSLNDAVERDYREGIARGVSHTPTVLVDGEPFIETFTVEEISAAIEKAGT